jgi:membrane protein
MAGRHRPAPLFGALIAAAATLYAARPAAAPSPHRAATPPRPGWVRILANVWSELGRDRISVMAAGVAFYSFLALFPGMSALISLYGLVADPAAIWRQLAALSRILPHPALALVSVQLHALIVAPRARLGIGFLVSLLLALWSATSGVATLMQALTVTDDDQDPRGLVAFYAQAIALTLGLGAFGLSSLFVIAVVPMMIDHLPIDPAWRGAIALISWPILAGLAVVALGLIYRFAPARPMSRWRWLSAGTVAAALLWLIASAGFSVYVARIAAYSATYGSLGAVVVLLMWFYLGAYVTLAGAALNREIERSRARG